MDGLAQQIIDPKLNFFNSTYYTGYILKKDFLYYKKELIRKKSNTLYKKEARKKSIFTFGGIS
tara:strand:+ start:412 stop:600 length:189 start_codon:yes stop_codon:yes gene_type:complete